ncbi:tol-pal system-associated acyl-CoA thioesterase [Halioxenophilus sp. WMMB6]|uniref:tol-pal system-associated acyl-CoA thioesterase n=1 Tax=Halioxenophilus sp. WMMB6 TaxID=3073815 RepID=UPI00295F4191|nr:tol-pal system-associated acyl-CoA thioesterase [Halioxenophilus sp. WMMB6]
MPQFSIPVRVYIEDTDAGGIVFYVNYLKFMERARTELLRSLGFDKPALTNGNGLLVVAGADIQYKKSAILDDLLTVTAEFEKVARSHVVFRQLVLRGEALLCSAAVKVACVDRTELRPRALPVEVYDAINLWHNQKR